MSNSQNSIPNFSLDPQTKNPTSEQKGTGMYNPIDIFCGLLFLVAGYFLYSWQPEAEFADAIENKDAIPKIKEIMTLMYLGLLASWFYRRIISI